MYDEPRLPEPSLSDIVGRVAGRADRANPAARRSAMRKLALMQRLGISPEQFGLGEEDDPTAVYRAMSPILGARRAIQSGTPDAYQLAEGGNADVAEYVRRLLEGASAQREQGALEGVVGALTPPRQDLAGHVERRIAAEMAGSSNREILNTMARGRSVAKALKHLRKLRPARRAAPFRRPIGGQDV